MLDDLDLAEVSGRVAYDRYVAIEMQQGGRTFWSLTLPLDAVPQVIPVPDPTRPTPGNRRVNPKHARDFGRYVIEQDDWVVPPIMLRDSGECRFTPKSELPDGSVIGVLEVPRGSRTALKIIDGQHRVLGLDLVLRDLDLEIERLQNELESAKAALAALTNNEEK